MTVVRNGQLSGATHDCAVLHCGLIVPVEFLMCRPHWMAVPERLRVEVWRAWRALQRGRGVDTLRAYKEARQLAVQSVAA